MLVIDHLRWTRSGKAVVDDVSLSFAPGSLALVTALGDGARLEAVPYAPDEQRWFVYRRADRLRQQMREAGFSTPIEDEIAGNREWATFLTSAV